MEKQKQDAGTEPTTTAPPAAEAAKPTPPAPIGLLSAADILGSHDLSFVDVPVPEWTPGWTPKPGPGFVPRKVRLRVMDGEEALAFADSQTDKKQARTTLVRLVCTTAIDQDGRQLFTEQDLAALMKKSFVVYKRLQDVALILNGFASEEDAQEEQKND